MTASNFARSLKLTSLSEGGYTRHKLDRGNWFKGRLIGTNHGISAPVLASWLGRIPTMREMVNLSKATADRIYKARYWDSVRGNDLPKGVDYAVWDYGVNSGPRRAIKELQRSVGTKPDGIIGGMTLRAIKRHHPKTIITRLMKRRLSFLQRLRSWKTFGRGWSRRIKRVREDAISMTNGE